MVGRMIMEQLSPGELLELIVLGEASIDVQFQRWLTSTFATIVASFAGRHLLTTKMRWIVSVLYVLATFVFVSRWYYDGVDLFAYRVLLTQAGIDDPIPIATLLSRLVLILSGTLATLYFVLVEPRKNTSG